MQDVQKSKFEFRLQDYLEAVHNYIFAFMHTVDDELVKRKAVPV